MGGSFARALRGFRDCVITGWDIDPEITALAQNLGVTDRAGASLTKAVEDADICLFCAGPQGILDGVAQCAGVFKAGSVVSEICGVKTQLSQMIAQMLPDNVRYIGLHPMAGKEIGGFHNSDANLFKNAGFILVPPENCDEDALSLMRELSLFVGAGRVVVNNAREHDALIAYSSDLPHIAATALVRSYPENLTLAHTAGAFRDCTRIADIDAELWAGLLSLSGPHLLSQLDAYIKNLQEVRSALAGGDSAALRDFLQIAGDNKRRIKTL
jgi:prephenate dehydrogenase